MKTFLGSVSPRGKLLWAVGLVLGLAALTSMRDLSAALMARMVLGGSVLVGLGAWWRRQGRAGTRFELAERMQVVSRAGLSQRCGLALVEVDGSSYLVAFGDGFAKIQRARGPMRPKSRSRRHRAELSGVKERLS